MFVRPNAVGGSMASHTRVGRTRVMIAMGSSQRGRPPLARRCRLNSRRTCLDADSAPRSHRHSQRTAIYGDRNTEPHSLQSADLHDLAKLPGSHVKLGVPHVHEPGGAGSALGAPAA